jgi:hypothetical protein
MRCSFCNKPADDVHKLIAGPNVFICDACVEVCNEIIADDSRFSGGTSPAAEGVAATDRPRSADVPPATSVPLQCRLCALPMLLDDTLIVEERGGLCPGCVDAVEAALAARRADAGRR